MTPDPAKTIYTHTFTCFAIAVAVNATVYTAHRVLTPGTKVSFVARALSRFLCANTALTAIVRAALFTTVRAFPSIVAVTFCFHAHTMPGAIVQTILLAARMPLSPGRAFAMPVL